MPNKGIRILKGFLDDYCDDLKDSFNTIIDGIESPIEILLLAALLSEAFLHCQNIKLQSDDDVTFGGDGPDIMRIFPQYQIDKYRVDFYIEYWDYAYASVRKLIIECDGHDFHEKTKEQATNDKRRDRHLQKMAPVFRFTGSEIHREAHICADQIVDFLMKIRTPANEIKKY